MSIPKELFELMREITEVGKVVGELRGENKMLREQNERLHKLLEQREKSREC